MQEVRARMEKTLEALKGNFAGVRTGRANPALLEKIQIDAYGQKMPIKQVGSINVLEGRTLSVTPFDKSNLQAIEKAISLSGLGVTPKNEGGHIIVIIPELNEERRRELEKVVKGMAEESKVAVRNIRRDAIDAAKKSEEYSEDQVKGYQTKVQELTDEYNKKIDDLLRNKEKEIREI